MNKNLPVVATTRLDRARDNAPILYRAALQLAAYVAQQRQDEVPARALEAVDLVNLVRLRVMPPERMIEWGETDRIEAKEEGWEVMRHGSSLVIAAVLASKDDQIPPFEDDRAAHRWVVAAAARGLSRTAIKGMAYLGQEHIANNCILALHAPLDRP